VKTSAWVLGLASFLAVGVPVRASDPAPAPIPALALKSGRTLHNVKIMSDEPDSLVVRASEGLIKVKKGDLPAEWAAKYPARSAPPETVSAPALDLRPPYTPPVRATRPPAQPARKAQAAPVITVFKGCTILAYEAKPFQSALGSAEIHIRNDSETPAEILPQDIVCLAADGSAHAGRFLVAVPDTGASIVKRKDVVPAYGELRDFVIFSTEALEITEIRWAPH